jgi:hypothetical protein
MIKNDQPNAPKLGAKQRKKREIVKKASINQIIQSKTRYY